MKFEYFLRLANSQNWTEHRTDTRPGIRNARHLHLRYPFFLLLLWYFCALFYGIKIQMKCGRLALFRMVPRWGTRDEVSWSFFGISTDGVPRRVRSLARLAAQWELRKLKTEAEAENEAEIRLLFIHEFGSGELFPQKALTTTPNGSWPTCWTCLLEGIPKSRHPNIPTSLASWPELPKFGCCQARGDNIN